MQKKRRREFLTINFHILLLELGKLFKKLLVHLKVALIRSLREQHFRDSFNIKWHLVGETLWGGKFLGKASFHAWFN
jgi:hypothetical protein